MSMKKTALLTLSSFSLIGALHAAPATSSVATTTASAVQAPVAAQMQFAKVNDAEIAYYIIGEGQGSPIIMSMSFGMSMQDWDPRLLQTLANEHEVIIYDNRGVGSSIGNFQNLTIGQMADDVVGLMDALHIQKANLLGFSIGSFITEQVAIKYPDRVLKIVLAGTAMPGAKMVPASQATVTNFMNIMGASWPVLASPMFPNDKAGRNALYQYLGERDVAIANGFIPSDLPETLAVREAQWNAVGTLVQQDTTAAALAKLNIPALVTGGANDDLINPKNFKLTAKTIPGARLIIYPHSGHAFLFQYPEKFGNAVNAFLK